MFNINNTYLKQLSIILITSFSNLKSFITLKSQILAMESVSEKELLLIKELRNKLADVTDPDKGDDTVLIRFIRAREHDLTKAENMIRKSFIWRQEKQIDKLVEWKPPKLLKKYYPWGISGYDVRGSPILISPLGRIDIKGLVESEGREAFKRYTLKNLEDVMAKMKQKSRELGYPITQMIVIMDCECLSIKQLTYKASPDLLIELVRSYEANYPETLKDAYIVNAPKIFTTAYSMIKPLLSKYTVSKIHIFDSDPKWKKVISEQLPPSEVPKHWGGSKKGPDEFCSNIICMGGPVPTRYYLKGSKMNRPGDDDEEFIKVTLPAGQRISFEYDIEEGSTLKWVLKSDSYDVGISINFEDVEILAYKRVKSHLRTIHEKIMCQKTGKYTINFDNTYSKFRSKQIYYSISIQPPKDDTMDTTHF